MNSEDKKPEKIKYNEVIVKDELDKFIFDDIHDSSKKLQEISGGEQIDKEIEQINKEVSSDLFSALYQWKPEISEDANPTIKQVLKTLKGLQEFDEMKDYTQSDDISSALGVNKMFPKVAEQYTQIKEELEKHEQEKKDAENNGDQQPKMPDSLSDKLGKMKTKLRKEAKKVNGDLKDFNDFCEAFGNDDSDLSSSDKQQKLNMFKKFNNNSKLKRISELLGRLKNFYKSEQSISYKHGNDEIIDVELGCSIERMIPSEVMKFNKNKKQFLMDFAEGKLMQYQMRGVEYTAKGPIVICLDCSASMSGERDIWSKSLTLAITDMAIKQKREVDVLLYNTKVVGNYKFTEHDNSKKMELANKGTGGGTNFNEPLSGALDIIRESNNDKTTDILFITDGQSKVEDSVIEEIKEFKKNKGLKVVGLLVQSGNSDELDKFCDKIHDTQDLEEDESKEIIREYL